MMTMLSPSDTHESGEEIMATTETSYANMSTTDMWMLANVTNITGSTMLEVPYEPYVLRPETYLVPIVFGMIFVVGVLGNGVLVVVFVRHRAMRNVPNT